MDKLLLKELKEYIELHQSVIQFALHQPKVESMEKSISEDLQIGHLEDFIKKKKQPSLNQILFKYIDEKGLSDPEIYKKAGIDRKHFSKIRTNPEYQPKKNTVFALALALELSLDQSEHLLSVAGYSLSSSDTTDLIIQFCLEKKIFDLHYVNQALEYFNQKII
ncbi:hypothetical protein [Evansella tamaricis]|uniref:XRE family transcriptional regulator n=1 Tax=Evansella tamaricis TaxID=2069301 RepID=A0ABS6JHF7_9BACI|nr:hypothetical protein [Evansella tamaricis]MBU9712830.1 hypothetical protein [Evansella tamaricis]